MENEEFTKNCNQSRTTNARYLGYGLSATQGQPCIRTFHKTNSGRTTISSYHRANQGGLSENAMHSLFFIEDLLKLVRDRYKLCPTDMEGEELRDSLLKELGEPFYGWLLSTAADDGLGCTGFGWRPKTGFEGAVPCHVDSSTVDYTVPDKLLYMNCNKLFL
jgi:hypothetical protein